MKVFAGISVVFQLLWLGLVGAGLWLLAGWLQLPVSPNLDAVIGVITLLWLYFVVTVPWNMVFQAKQVLFDAQTSRQRGIQIDPEAVTYAQRWARIALWIALALHVFTAAVLCFVAHSGVGLIGWLGAAAAIVLTLMRPGLRAYAHVRERLGRFAREVEVPREDAEELRRRLLQVEQQLAALAHQCATTTHQTEQHLQEIDARATAATDNHTTLAEHVRLEMVRVEREAKNTVAQVLGDASVVGHVRELVRFFKAA
nr:hypothetical protein [Rhodoferax sp.]